MHGLHVPILNALHMSLCSSRPSHYQCIKSYVAASSIAAALCLAGMCCAVDRVDAARLTTLRSMQVSGSQGGMIWHARNPVLMWCSSARIHCGVRKAGHVLNADWRLNFNTNAQIVLGMVLGMPAHWSCPPLGCNTISCTQTVLPCVAWHDMPVHFLHEPFPGCSVLRSGKMIVWIGMNDASCSMRSMYNLSAWLASWPGDWPGELDSCNFKNGPFL